VATVLENLAHQYFEQGKYDQAEPLYQRSLAIREKASTSGGSGLALTLKCLAELYRAEGNPDQAAPFYQRLFTIRQRLTSIKPQDPDVFDELAFLQATCPDEHFRDGKKAFENASKAYQLDRGQHGRFFDTLAAAYAENGDFKQARQWAAQAITLAKSETSKKIIRSHLACYIESKPFRDDGKLP